MSVVAVIVTRLLDSVVTRCNKFLQPRVVCVQVSLSLISDASIDSVGSSQDDC